MSDLITTETGGLMSLLHKSKPPVQPAVCSTPKRGF